MGAFGTLNPRVVDSWRADLINRGGVGVFVDNDQRRRGGAVGARRGNVDICCRHAKIWKHRGEGTIGRVLLKSECESEGNKGEGRRGGFPRRRDVPPFMNAIYCGLLGEKGKAGPALVLSPDRALRPMLLLWEKRLELCPLHFSTHL